MLYEAPYALLGLAAFCLSILGTFSFLSYPYDLKLKAATFIFGFGTLTASVAGVFYQLRTKARSENRQSWIKDIRECLTPLIARLPSPDDAEAEVLEKQKEYLEPHSKQELLLIPSEKVHRGMMARLRHA